MLYKKARQTGSTKSRRNEGMNLKTHNKRSGKAVVILDQMQNSFVNSKELIRSDQLA
jgi:hypothetical protein